MTTATCSQCGAPLNEQARCSYCATSGPDGEVRRLCQPVLLALDKRLKGPTKLPVVLAFLLFLTSVPGTFLLCRHLGMGVVPAAAMMVLVAAGMFAFFGSTVRKAQEEIYRRDIRPRLQELMTKHDVSAARLHRIADEELPDRSPLRRFMGDLV